MNVNDSVKILIGKCVNEIGTITTIFTGDSFYYLVDLGNETIGYDESELELVV